MTWPFPPGGPDLPCLLQSPLLPRLAISLPPQARQPQSTRSIHSIKQIQSLRPYSTGSPTWLHPSRTQYEKEKKLYQEQATTDCWNTYVHTKKARRRWGWADTSIEHTGRRCCCGYMYSTSLPSKPPMEALQACMLLI